MSRANSDGFVKSRKTPFFVIPAQAGIQFFQLVTEFLDSGFHRSDDFLRDRQVYMTNRKERTQNPREIANHFTGADS